MHSVQESTTQLLDFVRTEEEISFRDAFAFEKRRDIDFGPGIHAMDVLRNFEAHGKVTINLKAGTITVR